MHLYIRTEVTSFTTLVNMWHYTNSGLDISLFARIRVILGKLYCTVV